MTGYAWLMARLPRRWALPITQVGMGAMLLVLLGAVSGSRLVGIGAFYLAGQILGVLLISQFWTLANVVYDRAAGQTPVRLRRRRRTARRRRRQRAWRSRPDDRRHESAAAGRGKHVPVRLRRQLDRRPRKRAARVVARR